MTKKSVVSRNFCRFQESIVQNEGKTKALSGPLKFPADLVTFTEEIVDRKLHFLYGVHILE